MGRKGSPWTDNRRTSSEVESGIFWNLRICAWLGYGKVDREDGRSRDAGSSFSSMWTVDRV